MSCHKCIIATCSAVLFLVCLNQNVQAQQPTWRKIQPMTTARYFSGAAPISDHEVLVIGGYTSVPGGSASCEVIDVVGGTVSPASSLLQGRVDFAMVQLPDSNVVVLGGESSGVVGSIEIYDRVKRNWSKLGDLVVPRRQLTALLLTPTKILTVGGRNADLTCLWDCEIFDLATGTSHRVQNFPVITSLCKVLWTSEGKIVAFGGREGGPGSLRHKELYEFDVNSETWHRLGAYPTEIYFPYVVNLQNGKLFSTGGSYQETGSERNDYSDLLAIESEAGFDSVGHLNGHRALHCATLFDDDNVIVIGGARDDGKPLTSCEIVDPILGTSIDGPALNDARDLFAVVRLKPSSKRVNKVDAVIVAIGGRKEGGSPIQSVEVLDVQCDGLGQIDLMTNVIDVKVNGSAQWYGKRIRLTDTSQNDSGSAWYTRKLSIKNGFESDFMFRISNGSDRTQPDGGDPGADGIAFVLQNSATTALGHYGKGIGYAGISKSIAVEFDTYFNFESNDLNGNHVAIQSGGVLENQAVHAAPYLLGSAGAIETIHNDGRPYYGRITYDGSSLFVYLNETGIFEEPILTVANLNMPSLLGTGSEQTVWMGFTSATGIAWAQHEILEWKIRGCVRAMVPSAIEQESTAEESTTTFELSPNPVNSVLSIKIPVNILGDVKVQICDVQGTPMICVGNGSSPMHGEILRVDTSSLPPGCYMVRIESPRAIACSSLVVVH